MTFYLLRCLKNLSFCFLMFFLWKVLCHWHVDFGDFGLQGQMANSFWTVRLSVCMSFRPVYVQTVIFSSCHDDTGTKLGTVSIPQGDTPLI